MITVDDATAIIEDARREGVLLRLIGGLAFRVQAPGWPGRPSGTNVDIDLATTSSQRKRVGEVLGRFGFTPDAHHNALFGRRQMYFFDASNGRAVDVIVDRLEMCHTIDLRDRLTIEPITVPLADLLLSKLQIVKLNAKDAFDVLALLASHPIGLSDEVISLPRILEHTSRDWGWYRTVSANLDWIGAFAAEAVEREPLWSAGFDPIAQAAHLRVELDRSTKTLGWALRSRIGDRLPWYDLPEEVPHGE